MTEEEIKRENTTLEFYLHLWGKNLDSYLDAVVLNAFGSPLTLT